MNSRASEFRDAIQKKVFIRGSAMTPILHDEQTGARDEWIFDFRAIMLQPTWLNLYAELFWDRFAAHYPFQVGGLETASIALIAAIVMKGNERGTPVNGFYIRKSRKRQGLLKQIEGTLTDDPIILVDDLINSGHSFHKQLEVLTQLGRRVSDIFAILAFRSPDTYGYFADHGVRLSTLFSLTDFGIPLLTDSPDVPKDTFNEHWKYAPGTRPSFNIVQRSAPVRFENLVLYGADDGLFRALDTKTGSLVWSFKINRHPEGKAILSTACIHSNTVFFGAYDGTVYALDARSGAKRWQYDDADWIGSSPAVSGDLNLVFIGLEFGLINKRGGIAAIDIRTGQERWRAIHTALTHGSPLVIDSERIVVIGDNDGVVYAYRAADGTLLWKTPCDGDIKTTPAYDAKRNQVIVASIHGTVYALALHNGTPVKAFGTAGIYSIPLVHDDTVYIASLDKHVYAIDLTTWKPRWEFKTNGRIFASPRYFDGSIWIGSNDGRLYEIEPTRGTLVSFFQTSERILNAVAFDDQSHRIFVPTSQDEIYCISKRSNTSP